MFSIRCSYLVVCAGAIVLVTTTPFAQEVPLLAANSSVKTLERVVVVGTRPTSLPTHIPTTIEGVTGEQVSQTINATDAEDALKYFPSLLVRKRYIGDYDHAVLATRASGTGNSARSLVYADGILLSNLLGNGASFTPRWGLVTPEEIERVDVLYGPFSAAYSGNSAGAVVDYVTRMPVRFEAHAKVGGFTQRYEDANYGVNERFSGYQASASLGNRAGDFSWWINYNHLDSQGQPLVFANKPVSSGSAGGAGTPVTGALLARNPRNEPWLILGSTNQAHTVQEHAKLKLAYDFNDELRASYTFGLWSNEAVRGSNSYLRDAAGNPVYADVPSVINVDGRQYTLTPADFAPSRGDLRHVIHGLSVKRFSQDTWDWEVAASLYDYDHDQVRSPTGATPTIDTTGAGRIADLDGTGWNTLSLRGVWRPGDDEHLIDFGYQRDVHRLHSQVFDTNNWIFGRAGARFSLFGGKTELQSLFAQDTWGFADDWRATLGGRLEQWRASDGVVSNNSGIDLDVPGSRRDTYFSPKAAIAYQVTEHWALKTSVGRAVRNPTVSELYQGSVAAGQIVNNNPNLRAERSYTSETTAEREFDSGTLRTTLFYEDTRDALYSQQQASATGGTVNTVQNVQRIRTTGMELVSEMVDVLLTGFDLTGSVTYARSRIIQNDNFLVSEGKWQPRVPEWRANLLATYHVGETWTYTLGARYSGRQYGQLDNSDPNGESYTGVSKFFVADVRLRYRLAKQWHATFGIDNLNNEKYWAFHPYPQRTFLGELSWSL
ncbi:MAG: TonB-dependent receptor [Candidatus Obscuribacterales bacterium]|nr:TonB-dependent receptor [Steroidobacteraceae bacterium]